MIIIFHFPFLIFMQHAVNSVEHHFRNMSKHKSYLHFVRKHFWAELSHPRHGNKHVEKDQTEPATEKKQSWHKLDRRLSDKANKRIIVCLDWRLCRCQKMLGSMESRLSITLQKTCQHLPTPKLISSSVRSLVRKKMNREWDRVIEYTEK